MSKFLLQVLDQALTSKFLLQVLDQALTSKFLLQVLDQVLTSEFLLQVLDQLLMSVFLFRFLTVREQVLRQRRAKAEALLAWKRRLDEEEQEVVRLERQAAGLLHLLSVKEKSAKTRCTKIHKI